MALPQLPPSKKDLPPFLNDGTNKVEFVDGAVVDGPPDEPIPAIVLNFKVLESDNPMNAVGETHTIRIKCRGYSWGQTAQDILHAVSLLPKDSLNNATIEALLQSGKLAGRKAMVQQVTKTGPSKRNPGSNVTWREYRCAAVEKTAAL